MRGRSTRSRSPPSPEIAGADDLLAAFHAAHEQAYTFRLPDTPAEMVTFHLTAEREAPQVTLPELAPTGTVEAARLGERPVYFGESGESLVTPLFDRAALPAGARLHGPLLVQEPTATTLVLPGQALSLERHGLLVIEETG